MGARHDHAEHRPYHPILVAQMTQAEVISGTRRRVREGTIAPRVTRAIRLLLDRHTRREYLVIELTHCWSRS
jgi:hypothetical protein